MSTIELPQAKRQRPFHCGSQHADWTVSNCSRCTKDFDRSGSGAYRCDLQRAIDEAAWGDGSMPADIARRIGYDGKPETYLWQCGEVEWTEEWKREHAYRQTRDYRVRRRWAERRRRNAEKQRDREIAERMEIAEREHAANPGSCWGRWVSWAYGDGDPEDMPSATSAERCRQESCDGDGCYCCRFVDGVEQAMASA